MSRAAGQGRLGLTLVGACLLLVWLVSLVGPSAASRDLSGGALPPWSLGLGLSDAGVSAVLAVALIAGAAGSWLAWRAVQDGWAPAPRRLLAGVVLAVAGFALVAPVTSDDVYSYTAYGRMVVLGEDPYTTPPRELAGDPVVDAAGDPWRDAASVYGPLATLEQAGVMSVAGRSLRAGVWLLSVLGGLAFLATVALLDRTAPDEAARRRRLLLFGLNPLVVVQLVAAAHVDALLVLCVVAAVLAVRRYPLVAGLLAGAAVSVKLAGGLAVAGLAWHLRRAPRALAALALGVGLVAVPAYLAAGGTSSLTEVRRASRYVSFASPWRLLASPLDDLLERTSSRAVVSALSLLLFVVLLVVLARVLPDDGGVPAAWPVTLCFIAWLLAATYVLPWYDAWAWSVLALLPWSRWDELLLVRTTVLSLAYLPGRLLPESALQDVQGAVRGGVAPAVLLLLLAGAITLRQRPTSRLSTE